MRFEGLLQLGLKQVHIVLNMKLNIMDSVYVALTSFNPLSEVSETAS